MADDEFRDFYYSAQDGLRLHARIYGPDDAAALPVVCLPGLTRNARDFHMLAQFLSRSSEPRRKVIVFDYRGRGASAHDRDWRNYDTLVEAADIVAGLTAMGVEHAAFIGTSRGGLIIFALTAMRPSLLKTVVLNDVGPVLEGAGLAQIRAYLERAPRPANFNEAVAIQKSTMGSEFPALGHEDWERAVRALYRFDKGRPVPDFDPALLRGLKAIDFSAPLPVLWPQFAGLYGVPVMAIRGENSKLLSARTLEEMKARHPRIETFTVPGQGHAPFLETGDLPRRIAAFVNTAARSAASRSAA